MILVDSSVLIDVIDEDRHWCGWSLAALDEWSRRGPVLINPVIYTEISPDFDHPAALDAVLEKVGIAYREISREAVFLAAKAHQAYRHFDLWALERERTGSAPPAWSGFKFFNVYGFGERHKGKMSSVVLQAYDQIRSGGRLKLFKSHREGIGHGEQKRDFIYVDDVVSVLVFALKPLRRGIFNLGSGKARSFLDLARESFRALGAPEHIDYIDTPVESRDRYQYFTQAEMSKLRDRLLAAVYLSRGRRRGLPQSPRPLVSRPLPIVVPREVKRGGATNVGSKGATRPQFSSFNKN